MTTRALEDQEIKAIFENISGAHAERNETLLITGIGLALRASELVGLKVSDVYDRQVKSYVTIRPETAKFGKERTIRIGDGIQQTISDFLDWKRQKKESCAKRAPLFLSQKKGHLTRQALFEIVKRIFWEASIDQSPHCLRKTGATIYYIESNYDLIATQHFLGHADPSTTRRYIGLTSEQIVEYAERMSNHLFTAIREGKSYTNVQMSNFSQENLTIQDAVAFLNQQGFEVTLTAKQPEPERRKAVVAGSKVMKFSRAAVA
ncbi:site-specific integrase [bacterium]|nr:site-specific integrase [bacterium]